MFLNRQDGGAQNDQTHFCFFLLLSTRKKTGEWAVKEINEYILTVQLLESIEARTAEPSFHHARPSLKLRS